MDNEIFEKIKIFIIKESFVTDVTLTRETRIGDDLGINGADAIELIVAFGKQFNVDVTNFMTADYFEAEGHQFLAGLFKYFVKNETPSNKILTLGHLEKAVLAGRLDESIIEAES